MLQLAVRPANSSNEQNNGQNFPELHIPVLDPNSRLGGLRLRSCHPDGYRTHRQQHGGCSYRHSSNATLPGPANLRPHPGLSRSRRRYSYNPGNNLHRSFTGAVPNASGDLPGDIDPYPTTFHPNLHANPYCNTWTQSHTDPSFSCPARHAGTAASARHHIRERLPGFWARRVAGKGCDRSGVDSGWNDAGSCPFERDYLV